MEGAKFQLVSQKPGVGDLYAIVGLWRWAPNVSLRYFKSYGAEKIYPTKLGINLDCVQWSLVKSCCKEMLSGQTAWERREVITGLFVTVEKSYATEDLCMSIETDSLPEPIHLTLPDVKKLVELEPCIDYKMGMISFPDTRPPEPKCTELQFKLDTELLLATVDRWRGELRIGLRYFKKYEGASKLYPTKRGLFMSELQWETLCGWLKAYEKELLACNCTTVKSLGPNLTVKAVLVDKYVPMLALQYSDYDPIHLSLKDVQILMNGSVHEAVEKMAEKKKPKPMASKFPKLGSLQEEDAESKDLHKILKVWPYESRSFVKAMALLICSEIETLNGYDMPSPAQLSWADKVDKYFRQALTFVCDYPEMLKDMYKKACEIENLQYVYVNYKRIANYLMADKISSPLLDAIRDLCTDIDSVIENNVDLTRAVRNVDTDEYE